MARADALDQQRRELITNISHDLRTPLTSLHGYLETLSLKSDTLAENERRRYLAIALAQSAKVGRLAQALFGSRGSNRAACRPSASRSRSSISCRTCSRNSS